ncbi:MAG: hypothetical protein KGL39_14195 [Patescibacteria group bacterium]|nr:hypothetical protein [Patescibacteria group bacterium]
MKELIFAFSGFAAGILVSYFYGASVLAKAKAKADQFLADAKKGIVAIEKIPADVKLEILSLLGKL